VLANRQGCFLHSSGVVLGESGILFLGHSGAGKSTLRKMILSYGKTATLCDDRNVVQRWPEGYRVHGIWANKDLSDVSSASPLLCAIMFVEQAKENEIIPLTDRMEVIGRLLSCLIRPVEDADWWDRSLSLVKEMASEVPCFRIRFDLSGEIVEQLKYFCLDKDVGAEKI
jgi:energy-coupling factor transporter ATP-binding protein EcfA2